MDTDKKKVGRPATGARAVRYSISVPPEIGAKLPRKGASKKLQKILLAYFKKQTKI